MKKINLKEIKNKKKLLIISGVIVVLFLLLLINWDRMHYTKVLNDFYSGNHYFEIKARVPEEIRDRYYKERYETTEEEYKEKVKVSSVFKYKILKVRNVKRYNPIYNSDPAGNMDMDTFRNNVHAAYGKYGIDSSLIEKAYWVDIKLEIWTLAGIFITESEESIGVYQYNGKWHVFASEAIDTVQTR